MILRTRNHALTDCAVRQQSQRSRELFGREDLPLSRKLDSKVSRLARALPPQQEREPLPSENLQNAQSQLELLERLTSRREKGDMDQNTIGEQLAKRGQVDSAEEMTVPLGKQVPFEYDDLTISQKRNIRRQKYLDQVSKRNDAPFFAAIALFVILPPAVILGVAVATGYINFLP